jgi:hypothetical protein
VRKESSRCRKAITKQGQTNVSLKTWLAEFYSEHVDYVVESLLFARGRRGLVRPSARRARGELERLDSRGAEERMLELLEAWDASAAAELAARVRSSTEKK